MSPPTFPLLDGTKIPVIAWGNGTGEAKVQALKAGNAALKAGLRHVDTAQGYNNEKETGEIVRDSGVSRAEIYVTTKLSQKDGSSVLDPIPLSSIRASVQSSITALGFQPDLLLVHNPFVPAPGELVKFWQVLEEMKDAGELTASIGVSNFRPQDLEEILAVARYVPVVNQIEYHPYVGSSPTSNPSSTQARHNILTEAYGPLSPLLRHPTGGPLKPILERIAKRLSDETGEDVDAAMVLLLWTRAMGVVAVTASGNEGRIAKIAKSGELPELREEEVGEIEEAGRRIHFRAYDEHMTVDFPSPDLPSE